VKKSTFFYALIDDSAGAGYIEAMKMRRLHIPVLLIIIILFSVSCSSKQEFTLENSGSGTAELEIELHPFFVQYLRDLVAAFADPTEDFDDFRVFDEMMIAESFISIEGLELTDFERFAPGHIRLSAAFTNPENLLPPPADPGSEPVITFLQEPDSEGLEALYSLRIRLDSRNVQTLYSLLGVEEQQNMLTFGPQPDPMNDREYIEMMSYALGTYEDEEVLKEIIETRKIEITLRVEGTIVEGWGVSFKKDTATLTMPFLRPATLQEPIEFYLKWREQPGGLE